MAYQDALRVWKKPQSQTANCLARLCFKLFNRARSKDYIEKENSVIRVRIEDEKTAH